MEVVFRLFYPHHSPLSADVRRGPHSHLLCRTVMHFAVAVVSHISTAIPAAARVLIVLDHVEFDK